MRLLVLMSMLCAAIISDAYAQQTIFETKEQSIARLEKEISATDRDSSLVTLHRQLFYLYVNDDLDKAIYHIQQTIQYALDAQMLDIVTMSYSDFGNTYTQKGDFKKAFESLETANTYNVNFTTTDRSALINFFLGRTWLELQVYDLAKTLLDDSETKFISERNKWLPAYELTRIDLYQGKLDVVLAKLPELEADIPETNNQVNTDYLYHYLVLAELYAEVDELAKATSILDRIAPYVIKHNRNYYRGILNYSYALIALKQSDNKSVVEYSLKAKMFFENQQEFFYYLKALNILSMAYSELGDYKSAYQYLSQFEQHTNAIEEAQHTAISNHLHSKSHIELLNENKLQEQKSQINARQTIIYILVFMFIALGVVAFIFYRSANEKKKISEQLKNHNLDKNHFIGVVSHDLRSPLNSIMVLAEFMKDDPEMMDQDTAKEYGSIIFNSSQQMQQLLNNMLDVNKIESNQTNIDLQSLDALPILKKNYESISIHGKTKGINTRLDVPESLSNIEGNENAIIRILENLISNAYKFSPIDSTVTLKAQEIGSQIEISITDQGPGLTDLDKTKLFKKFEKLSASPTGNEKSTGLGLYIVKNLVQQMNGTILIESEQGKGTTFKVLLNKA